MENLLPVAPERTDASFYRSSGGAEIDLILSLPGRQPWAIEIKRSLDPKPARGFHHASEDVMPEARYVVYPGAERFAISADVDAIGIDDLAQRISQCR